MHDAQPPAPRCIDQDLTRHLVGSTARDCTPCLASLRELTSKKQELRVAASRCLGKANVNSRQGRRTPAESPALLPHSTLIERFQAKPQPMVRFLLCTGSTTRCCFPSGTYVLLFRLPTEYTVWLLAFLLPEAIAFSVVHRCICLLGADFR